jgi:haloacetate dehalogenase
MFDGFESRDVTVDGVAVHAMVGGSGPPVLLLHGYPQTHVMWHRVAPVLARHHTVVAPDLRGYGDSAKPAGEPDHANYSKRSMAADQVGLMGTLGFGRFAVVGHDRGARVAHRMCLDHPERVTRVAVLDIVPTRHMFATTDRVFAHGYYHWFFLAQLPDLPERLIGADPEYYLHHKLGQWSAQDATFTPEAVAEYVRCFSDPASIHGSCEDYRAAATIDLEHDEADAAAGRRVDSPLLALWGAQGFVGRHYDVKSIWHDYATNVSGTSVDCGHFLAEEAPGATTRLLTDFLTA